MKGKGAIMNRMDLYFEMISSHTTRAGLALAAWLAGAVAASACTDLLLPPGAGGEDTSMISARTMDFGVNLTYYFDVVPRGYSFESDNPSGWRKYGCKWQGSNGFIGVSGAWPVLFDNDGSGTRYFDGMNEKGLSAALLWLDKSAGQYPDPVAGTTNLSIQHVVAYVLSLCDTVADVTNEMAKMVVWQQDLGISPLNVPLLLHLVVHDAHGDSALIEWYGKTAHVHGPAEMNALRIVANDPDIGGHVNIATNWTTLTAANGFKSPADDRHLDTNYLALPGDSSSASRYLRIRKLNDAFQNYYEPFQNIWPRENPSLWRINMASRLIGRNEEVYGEYPDEDYFFHTVFTLMRDHTNKRLYYRGVYNSNLKMIDFSQINFTNTFECRAWVMLDPDPAEPCHFGEQARDVTGVLGSQMGYQGRIDGLTNTTFSLDYTFVCQTSTIPEQGSMFLYCYAPDGRMLYWTGSNWVENLDLVNRVIPPCYTGSLVNVTFTNLFKDLSVADWAGTHIYAGYGHDQADMFLNNKIQLVGVVADPFTTWDAHLTNVVLNIASGAATQIIWQSFAGYDYQVQASTNLFSSWHEAGTVTGAYGAQQWPLDTTKSQLFYRIKVSGK
jgi:choloylglycine hydrolase